ncbi:MAG TPA: hypothetical protein VI864_07040 [Candidatus Bathyarchaeia archaeon]|nr:hypothetical protein [Candidatus Bathyarchaeia archaeon]
MSLFVGYPIGQSVIEEKGEGFENGKNSVGSVGVAFNLDNPPCHVIRLKTLYTYKSITHHN